MNQGRIVFAQLTDWIPKHEFDLCVTRYNGNKHIRSMSCYDQWLIMAFAQLTGRESLRDISVGLQAQAMKRSTLADANENRDWRIFEDFAQVLIRQAGPLYAGDDFGIELDRTAYALDSTTIDLCLSLFPWATFRRTKAAVKLHMLLTLQGNYPTVVIITPGRVQDVNILDQIPFDPGCFYIMDRGYLDYQRLHAIHRQGAFFVTREKDNARYRRQGSSPVIKSTGLRFDQTVLPFGFYSRTWYPDLLRRVGYVDKETGNRLVFLSNNLLVPALTLARLYRARWQVELFFKWIKQHLRIKVFFGTSENAVKTQIWIALSVYVLIAIVNKYLKLSQSPYTILQILGLTLFEKMPILQAFNEGPLHNHNTNLDNTLYLRGF
jgi:hypothetical protein